MARQTKCDTGIHAGALCHLDEVATARAKTAVALQTDFEVRSLFALISTVPMLALVLSKEGQIEAATELYALAETQPHVANSQWFADVAGAEIAAAAKALPADAVTAAQERGRASTLLVTHDVEAKITVLCAGN